VRVAYLIAGIIVAVLVIFNVPRLPWIAYEVGGPVGIFRGFEHGMIGFSYQVTWFLIASGVYMLILGIVYWDMDTSESLRWQFTLNAGGTARLLWVLGAVTLVLGILYAVFTYSHDQFLWPCGIVSTLVALVGCWLFWLAFPLYEQVGIEREDLGV
jgi:hypothetical protein